MFKVHRYRPPINGRIHNKRVGSDIGGAFKHCQPFFLNRARIFQECIELSIMKINPDQNVNLKIMYIKDKEILKVEGFFTYEQTSPDLQ